MNSGVVHVIDDDAAMRDSLSFLLESADLANKTYESAVVFLEHVKHLEPGCIVTDVRMPEMSGLELIQRLKTLGVTLPIIVMTGHADVPLAIEAMKAGVHDFIEKPFDDEALLTAIRAALAQAEDQAQRSDELAGIRGKLASLSTREREVLQGLVAGQANKVIAYDLGISPRTVEIYRANVMTKMGAASLSELVRMTLAAERE
ncbi:response regulator FixJ [Phenylobacterium soli]|uniref:DNA-binding response regulator n=1 Tax=Phenylobacterium soli TaxID=2170551 RepID=A0A328AHI6_9CAUL|nr:response regulator FixJ [Phenylobacterium soli]RAK54011.1 DNA-binding response regulator [Phenylobacterium soli]